jgi:Esterase/lipase
MVDRRAFLSGAVLAGGYLLAGKALAAEIDPITLVDPDLRAAALAMRASTGGFPPLSDETLPLIRQKIGAMRAAPLESPPFAEKMIPGSSGQPPVRVYIVNAKPGAARPAIIYLHGGGFIFGDAGASVREMQGLAAELDCTILLVDYRLAPEARYTASVEDNYAALKWAYTHAADLGIDSKRIAVMGESAGGGHAALLAIAARDRGEVPVLFQVLVYPMLDDRTASTIQAPAQMGTFVWAGDANRYGWRSFLGRDPGGAETAGVPGRNPNLKGLPPAFIGVGTLDLFFDEDVEYARRLADAGVPVELRVEPGAYHGFDHNPAAAVAKRFNAAKLDALRRAFKLG